MYVFMKHVISIYYLTTMEKEQQKRQSFTNTDTNTNTKNNKNDKI